MPRKGQHLTPEQRQKIRESRFNLTPAQRENIAAAQRGKTASVKTRAKMSAAHMGHSVSEKARTAIGNAHRGKVVSEKSKELNRQKHIGNVASDKTKEKMRESHLGEKNGFYGKTHSEENKQKMHEAKSEETKIKMSEAKKGQIPANIEILKVSRIGSTNSEEHRRIVREALTGLIRSEETKQKVADNRAGKCTGADNAAWRGGVTPLRHIIRGCPKYYNWRDAVFARDGYMDVITGESGSEHVLNAHHVISFEDIIERNNITTYDQAMSCKELWDVSNGITMTQNNHIIYHATTGKPE